MVGVSAEGGVRPRRDHEAKASSVLCLRKDTAKILIDVSFCGCMSYASKLPFAFYSTDVVHLLADDLQALVAHHALDNQEVE